MTDRFHRCYILLLALCAAIPANLLAQESELKPGQSFELRISGVPAEEVALMSQKYGISDAGMISLPYLKEKLSAAGLKPSALARRIEEAYRQAQIYTRPVVQIDATGGTIGERFVSVLGEVRTTGSITFQPGLTLVAAIAQCGGFTDFAYTRDVKLTRGEVVTYHNPSEVKENVQLEPGDIVTVRAGRRR